ncbi:MAG: hypothetical protein AVO33_03015 [delta proteobacterium ML8_F1]|nr:MAG: hypothetical protein AVO33_03015 [delta proteobacterium ML8_F1]
MDQQRKFKVGSEKMNQPDSSATLTEHDLDTVTGGMQSPVSGKRIVNGSYSCERFEVREGVDPNMMGTKCCSYCRHKNWEGTYMVCNLPVNEKK